MHVRFWLSLLLSWAIAIAASSVRADSAAVTILGVRSLDAEDQLERRVSHALRDAARSVEGYRVSEREVSLAQMSLAHGCEEVDPPCLKDIAGTLSADRLIYGNMVRSGDKVRITLFNFDARTGQIDASTERTVLAAQLVEPMLSETLRELMQRIGGKRAAVGTLRIAGNRPGASVMLDGKPAGRLDESGYLVLEQVSEGTHTVAVESEDGQDRRELNAQVRADATTTVRALLTPALADESAPAAAPAPVEPPPENRGRLLRILGWTSVGIAAGFAAATIYSWVRIENIEGSRELKRYALEIPGEGQGSSNDVCREARAELYATAAAEMPGNQELADKAAVEKPATKLCREADKLETLQWVFVGGTAAFAAVGTGLLWKGYRDRERSVSFSPSLGLQTASLRATLRF